jgi:hypothetical protein
MTVSGGTGEILEDARKLYLTFAIPIGVANSAKSDIAGHHFSLLYFAATLSIALVL